VDVGLWVGVVVVVEGGRIGETAGEIGVLEEEGKGVWEGGKDVAVDIRKLRVGVDAGAQATNRKTRVQA
jgi:hypothetical protein